jgi:hypothetical protein
VAVLSTIPIVAASVKAVSVLKKKCLQNGFSMIIWIFVFFFASLGFGSFENPY